MSVAKERKKEREKEKNLMYRCWDTIFIFDMSTSLLSILQLTVYNSMRFSAKSWKWLQCTQKINYSK